VSEANALFIFSQYTMEEYEQRVGFGHSSLTHAFRFAQLADVKQFVPFHHDPAHTDSMLDQMIEQTVTEEQPPFIVTPGIEGTVLDLESYTHNS